MQGSYTKLHKCNLLNSWELKTYMYKQLARRDSFFEYTKTIDMTPTHLSILLLYRGNLYCGIYTQVCDDIVTSSLSSSSVNTCIDNVFFTTKTEVGIDVGYHDNISCGIMDRKAEKK